MLKSIKNNFKGPFQTTFISIGEFLNNNNITYDNCTEYLTKSEENQIIVLKFICSLGEKLKKDFGTKFSILLPNNSTEFMNHKIDKKIKNNVNLFVDDDNHNLKNCIIMHYFCSKFNDFITIYNVIKQNPEDKYLKDMNSITAEDNIHYLRYFLELIIEHYCEKNKNIHDNYEPLKDIKGNYITIQNIVKNDDQYKEVKNNPGNYYVEHKNFNYNKKTPKEIYEHITNYPRMEQINQIEYTKSTAVGHSTSGAASYQINGKYINILEYENIIFKKIEHDPNEGGKRRKSRRNRKTKRGKKSRKARKSRRKSNRRR
jgi:hypothetical protein